MIALAVFDKEIMHSSGSGGNPEPQTATGSPG